jgi:starch phosphorylase
MYLRNIFVYPKYPESLKKLLYFAYNLWALWDTEAIQLFKRIDPDLFRNFNRNPIRFLHSVPKERLIELSKDKAFLSDLDKVWEKFDRYTDHYTEYNEKFKGRLIAYFSMEYGLHISLPIYAGGLGILSGDHLKGASDLGIPTIGVGLFYRYGYFNQSINMSGIQEEEYLDNNVYYMPVKELKTTNGELVYVSVSILDKQVKVKVWLVNIGRVRLLLLDTNIEENPTDLRNITDYLYDARRDYRIMQEIILGFGGMKALKAMQINPDVFHLNEGHSAFLIIQRLRNLMLDQNYTFDEAYAIIKNTTVFTTHTPVEAGNENFTAEMIEKYLKNKVADLNINIEQLMKFGMLHDKKTFWLPAFAIRFAKYVNGVSKIHSNVSKQLWKDLFPQHLESEIPIIPITNGVHHSWLSDHLRYLFERYFGSEYFMPENEKELYDRIEKIPNDEIWQAHVKRKQEMIAYLRILMEQYYAEKGYSLVKIKKLREMLKESYLTIGFARRFAAYKRPNLILKDRERLRNILVNSELPVQMIFSGKAHPADETGKNMVKEIIDFSKEFDVEDRMIFIENYDRVIGENLVQGVDVWLNTPMKPFEASGTSGMKAGMNGVLNLSVLDGWWPECFNEKNGWAIKSGRLDDHSEMRHTAESNQIYELLEGEIAPLFYRRDERDIPLEWISMMKASIYSAFKGFNINRVLAEYSEKCYLPAIESRGDLIKNNGGRLEQLMSNIKKTKSIWEKIYIKDVFTDIKKREILFIDDLIHIDCYVFLDDADPELINVELLCLMREQIACETVRLNFIEKYSDKVGKYEGELKFTSPGVQSVGVRILPSDPDVRALYPDLMKWNESR